MNDDALAALAARHGLAPDIVDDLRALMEGAVPDESQATWSPDLPDASSPVSASLGHRDEAPSAEEADRYEPLGKLGAGGMAVVSRVRDRRLNRVVAMKVIKEQLVHHPLSLARFVEEAQISAQLQHPGIVPLHDFGTLADGKVWFTMDEVHGQTLTRAIRELHAASGPDGWKVSPSGWSFRRLVDAIRRVCEAVEFAHSRGVIHRDLKPDNVMLGEHGEVRVLDWGLAKLTDGRGIPDDAWRPVQSDRAADAGMFTRVGQVAGTPAYMPPEQARGEGTLVDARSDVYALGSVLYHLLSGRPPYSAPSAMAVLEEVREGAPPTLRPVGARVPEQLVAACERAMARERSDRLQTAALLADELRSWLEGARLSDQARVLVDRALALDPEAHRLRVEAETLSARADALLADVASWEPEDSKLAGWRLQDEAAELRRRAEGEELALERGLHGALRIDPDLPEAHAALASRYRARHAQAEFRRDRDGADRAETLVRLHLNALAPTHATHVACLEYLKGEGTLTLVTEPSGAQVQLVRYEEHHRRLVEVPVRSLGTSPIRDLTLAMGRYLCVIEHPDCETVRYPVEIARNANWSGVAPGDLDPTPVWLPPRGTLGPNEQYVPAGWFQSGGDPTALASHPARRIWCDGFVIQRFPVVHGQYIAFLDDLVARGQAELALKVAPRIQAGADGGQGQLLYGFDGARFHLEKDSDGDVWQADWPAFHVPWPGARAYFAWLSDRDGRHWRLPDELEWEKAARGVDGRWYPWGDRFDPSWACVEDSHAGRALPVSVDSFPMDVSPYGVRGMGGNVFDWCLGPFDGDATSERVRIPSGEEPGLRVTRGGGYLSSERGSRAAFRDWYDAIARVPFIGFRGVYRL